ncbi:hypothetical protein BN59_01892 [Legionella massiliensis]|uniref:Uncharacterized protein n=1 Tax=Legionella massiliensis TaxID=1034943 RepID=A0A078L0R4_9GAMM|nr:YopJ family acetyltransferase [Legionella massiliensis]CDZ77608.1 hypothetical protein BN59_01892 [Legionella massiliensis]CEE13346.1 hypothetical protein BN1094_01892 [Legionella massiliensis]
MKDDGKIKDAKFPFNEVEIKELIAKQSFKPHLMIVKANAQPTAFVDYLMNLSQSNKSFREQCIVLYNEHWFGLDLERKKRTGKISIVILDAAAPFTKVAAFMFLMKQISQNGSIAFDTLLIGSNSDKNLQRNNRDCSTYAWELLKWAKESPNLHDKLFKLSASIPNQLRTKRQILPKIANERISAPILEKLRESFLEIHWLDSENLKGEEWAEFFINSQSTLPAEFADSAKKWIVEELCHDSWTEHNIRINYCEHLMKVELANTPALSENDFIIKHICTAHGKTENELGLVLRLAISKGLIFQVRALLDLSNVDVNELPASKMTALDRAYALDRNNPVREEIILLLKAKNAIANTVKSPIQTSVERNESTVGETAGNYTL